MFAGKKLFLAPYSPLTKVLRSYIEANFDAEILGFIDRSQEGEDICRIADVRNKEFDHILIYSPNHFGAIFKEYTDVLGESSKLLGVDIQDGNYVFTQPKEFSKNKEISRQNQHSLFTFFTKFFDILPRKKTVFVCEEYVDANIKHLALYCHRNSKSYTLLTDNETQLKKLEQNGLHVKKLGSFFGTLALASAKTIVLDHVPLYTPVKLRSAKQKLLQLWHGVGLKPLTDHSGIVYDTFISTSNWTNESNFQNVFNAKEFLNLGYPRNDVLLKEHIDELDLLLCDKELYDKLAANSKKGIRNILYMPTFRENGGEADALDLVSLNEACKEMNVCFIIKFHPFTMKKYFQVQKSGEAYSNILFYTSQGDIYPILRHIDVLVSDYSSIVYDFLPLQKPIVFYNYDFEEYAHIRGKLLFDYDEFSPGDKVKTQIELMEALQKNLQNDDYRAKREAIRKRFFDFDDADASKRIVALMEGEQ